MHEPKSGLPEKGFYYHYKRTEDGVQDNYTYEVIGIAKDTETETFSVLYRPLYKSDWMVPADCNARPLEMFTGTVEVGGKKVPRFVRVTDTAMIQELKIVRDQLYG